MPQAEQLHEPVKCFHNSAAEHGIRSWQASLHSLLTAMIAQWPSGTAFLSARAPPPVDPAPLRPPDRVLPPARHPKYKHRPLSVRLRKHDEPGGPAVTSG